MNLKLFYWLSKYTAGCILTSCLDVILLINLNQGVAHSFLGGSVDRESREYPYRNPYLD